MKACPKCKGRATKLVNISTGIVTCQQCRHEWLIEMPEHQRGVTLSGQSLRPARQEEK